MEHLKGLKDANADNMEALLNGKGWTDMQEELYLKSIPGEWAALSAAALEGIEDGIDADGVDFGV